MLGIFSITVLPAKSEEDWPAGFSPAEAVMHIAAAKARDTATRAPADSLILAADTVVCLDGQILGKPVDAEDARRMLRMLSGRTHTVYTGMALQRGNRQMTDFAEASVTFRPLSDAEIDAYVSTGSPLDKAGAYGAQDMAALFVERVEGEFYTVVGLPMCRLAELFRSFGEPLLNAHA